MTLPGKPISLLNEYLTEKYKITDEIAAGTVNVTFLDLTVAAMLRTKFALGLFEGMTKHHCGFAQCFADIHFLDPYPYADYLATIRTPASKVVLAQADADSIVLLENHNNILPLKKNIGSVALIGPQVNRVSVSPFYMSLRVHVSEM